MPGKWPADFWLLGDQLGAEDVDLGTSQELLHGGHDLPGPGEQAHGVVARPPPERHLEAGST